MLAALPDDDDDDGDDDDDDDTSCSKRKEGTSRNCNTEGDDAGVSNLSALDKSRAHLLLLGLDRCAVVPINQCLFKH